MIIRAFLRFAFALLKLQERVTKAYQILAYLYLYQVSSYRRRLIQCLCQHLQKTRSVCHESNVLLRYIINKININLGKTKTIISVMIIFILTKGTCLLKLCRIERTINSVHLNIKSESS